MKEQMDQWSNISYQDSTKTLIRPNIFQPHCCQYLASSFPLSHHFYYLAVSYALSNYWLYSLTLQGQTQFFFVHSKSFPNRTNPEIDTLRLSQAWPYGLLNTHEPPHRRDALNTQQWRKTFKMGHI